jgi:hypothetical protein
LSFLLAVFLVKYRIEYVLTMPFITVMYAWYLAMAPGSGASARSPEKLYKERGLMIVVALLVAVFVLTTRVDLPALGWLASQWFIVI